MFFLCFVVVTVKFCHNSSSCMQYKLSSSSSYSMTRLSPTFIPTEYCNTMQPQRRMLSHRVLPSYPYPPESRDTTPRFVGLDRYPPNSPSVSYDNINHAQAPAKTQTVHLSLHRKQTKSSHPTQQPPTQSPAQSIQSDSVPTPPPRYVCRYLHDSTNVGSMCSVGYPPV